MHRVHVEVRGRVQGVFFRASCVERARALGVAGWVRNTPGGLVEAEFEGEPGAIAAMVDWCAEGPPFAAVEHVEVRDEPPTGEQGFRVAR
ncbi:MAG: acylphosphatase [Actinomycetota bacterium]|nr:acylphosphatase [Actinomycetota bacterium]